MALLRLPRKSSSSSSALLFSTLAAILIVVGTLIFVMTRPSSAEVAESDDSSTQAIEEKQSEVSNNRIAVTPAESPEQQEENLADIVEEEELTTSLPSSLESQFPGVWSRVDDSRVQARFNADGSAERLDVSMKGSWKVEDDLIIVTWMRANRKLVIPCRIEPSEPNILLVLQDAGRVRDRLKREE